MSEAHLQVQEEAAESKSENPTQGSTTTAVTDKRHDDEQITLGYHNGIGLTRSQSKKLLAQMVTFCGVTKSIGDWATHAGLRFTTVVGRLKRGDSPLKALTTHDTEGHCLRKLSDEFIQQEIKQEMKRRSGPGRIILRGKDVAYATIVADHRVLYLGAFATKDEAVHAFNAAVALLPDEWEDTDRVQVETTLPPAECQLIETQVKERLDQHILERSPEGRNVFDYPARISVNMQEFLSSGSDC